MTEPGQNTNDTATRLDAARETARRETFRLARDAGAQITRPMFCDSALTTTDVEPLAGASAARDLEFAARRLARDYIRQARETGHGWDQIAQALGLFPSTDQPDATEANAAYDYATGPPDPQAPWEPRYFHWTCRSCDQHISDHGLIQGPADDEPGHARGCPRLAAAITAWDTAWDAEWEAGQ